MRKVKVVPSTTEQLEAYINRLKELGCTYQVVTYTGKPAIELEEGIATNILRVSKKEMIMPARATAREIGVMAVLIIIIIALISNQNSKPETSASSRQSDTTEEVTALASTPVETEEEKVARMAEQLQREIDFFEKPFDNKPYRGSIESLMLELVLIQTWSSMATDALAHYDESIREKGTVLEKKLSAFQVKEFPAMRKEFVRLMDKALWEENIEAKAKGKGNTTIEFVGGYFASNKNIKKTQETIYEQLLNLRFKRVNYLWSEYADEYTYYKVESKNDSEVKYEQ